MSSSVGSNGGSILDWAWPSATASALHNSKPARIVRMVPAPSGFPERYSAKPGDEGCHPFRGEACPRHKAKWCAELSGTKLRSSAAAPEASDFCCVALSFRHRLVLTSSDD